MKRPSHRELDGKLRKARKEASKKRFAFVEPEVILSDLLDLNFLVEELADRLPEILSEIRPRDYQGRRLPAKSYEKSILDCELFAFRWSSKVFGCRMYLKFAIKGDYLWIVSLHKHREPERGEPMNCPNEHGKMILKTKTKEVTFRNKRIKYPARHYVCTKCGIEVDDIALAAENQRKISDAYRKAANLLTSEQIVSGRKKLKWSQEHLAKAMNVGIASVKRWETGQIQTKPMDDILRRVLSGNAPMGDLYTGNRTLSLPRIKLVLNRFSELLGREMLKEDPNDKLLYEAKYLWYADMIAYRETGQSMTGATYARLPQGPQLNNYKDLIPMIRECEESKADPLTDHEFRIISRVAAVFPSNQKIYRAVHKEKTYKSRKDGELISYTNAESIKVL